MHRCSDAKGGSRPVQVVVVDTRSLAGVAGSGLLVCGEMTPPRCPTMKKICQERFTGNEYGRIENRLYSCFVACHFGTAF